MAALDDAPVADLMAVAVEVQEESEREALRQLEAPTQPSGCPLLPTTCFEARVGEERAQQA